ncbi:hypothetical protein [Roseimaritima sediminicola]|uniref:hypothetical protein n=1 Tax=Roseimaritima sediminicola TaxID=2662066 RepID=UPI00129857FE|nr:hypothetical protein [Roseimaritima sediminicola]
MAEPKRNNQWKDLAAAGMSPPGGTPLAIDTGSRKPETLTEKFNRAADPRDQLPALRRKMSQPKATLERTPFGSVSRSINTERDKRIAETIKAMTQILSKKRQAEMKVKLGEKNQIKKTFNKASGMSM